MENKQTDNVETIELTEEQVREALRGNYAKAEKVLKDKDKVEKYLREIEEKLKALPKVGNALSKVPVLVSMVRRFIKKEYTEAPVGTIVAIMAALIYLLSPIDVIPDAIPVVGYIDDAAVIGFCVQMIGKDLECYEKWREKNYPAEVQA